jgi:hypothetical protein
MSTLTLGAGDRSPSAVPGADCRIFRPNHIVERPAGSP